MSEAIINSILYNAEKKIEHLTGQKGKAMFLADDALYGLTNAQQLLDKCCLAMDVTPEDVRRKDRHRRLVTIRQCLVLVIKTIYPQVSYKDIGKLVGIADHTTVIHNYQAANMHLSTGDDYFLSYYNKVKHLLNDTYTI